MKDGSVTHRISPLVRLLDLDLIRYSESLDFLQIRGAVFIDNQGTTTGLMDRLLKANVPPLMIIDHHERQERMHAEYTDIRRIGATATIYTEYIQEGLLILDRLPSRPCQMCYGADAWHSGARPMI